MKCIGCQHVAHRESGENVVVSEIERIKIDTLKQGFTLCDAEIKKAKHDLSTFYSLTFERDCKLFKKADDEAMAKRVNWFDGIKRGFKSEVINGDRVYRQKMEMKRRKYNENLKFNWK